MQRIVKSRTLLRSRHLRVRSVVGLVGLLTWLILDPLGIQAYYGKAEANLANRIAAEHVAPDMADEIAVVVLDRTAMAIAGETWPADYSLHARVLGILKSRYEPRAILVDLLFIEQFEGRSLDPLRDALIAYDPTPVFIATTLQQEQEQEQESEADGRVKYKHGIRDEIVQLAKDQPHIELVWVPKYTDMRFSDHYHFQAPRLPELGPEPLPTAAYAIYRRLCIEAADPPGRLCRGTPIPDVPRTCHADVTTYGGPADCSFEVLWRTSPPPLTAFLDACVPADDKARWFAAWTEPRVCPPHSTVPAHLLLYPEPDLAARMILPDQYEFMRDSFTLAPRLKDKIVIYGTDLTLDSDFVVPPTHVPLPGIYLHAMALENLFWYGNGFKSGTARWADAVGPHTWFGQWFGATWLATLLRQPPATGLTVVYVIVAFAVTVSYLRHVDATLRRAWLQRLRIFVGHLALAAILLSAMSALAFWLGLAIASWIGILVTVFTVLVLVDHIGEPRDTPPDTKEESL
jgi:hypothetical protein